LAWSHGEVTKPETINYRTQRAEKDGLFCEKYSARKKTTSVIAANTGESVTRHNLRQVRRGGDQVLGQKRKDGPYQIGQSLFSYLVSARRAFSDGNGLDIPMFQLEN